MPNIIAPQIVAAGADGQMSPTAYQNLTLAECLRKRPTQLPATHNAADYADECAAQLSRLMEAIAANDDDTVQEIVAWTHETHPRFHDLRGLA